MRLPSPLLVVAAACTCARVAGFARRRAPLVRLVSRRGRAATRLAPMVAMRTRKLGLGAKKKPSKKKITLSKVPGISAPDEGKLRGWALDVGEGSARLCAATLGGALYVLESDCSRCAWELEKGDLRGSAAGEPSVACALCGQAYGLRTGEPGGVAEKKGVDAWVSGLARGAPTSKPARPQAAVRADVVDGDVYLDLSNPFFARAAKKGR